MTDNDSEEPRGASGMFSSVPARIGRYRQQAAYFTRLAETEPVVRIRDQWENLARDYASLANTLGDHSDQTLFWGSDIMGLPKQSRFEDDHSIIGHRRSITRLPPSIQRLLQVAQARAKATRQCKSKSALFG